MKKYLKWLLICVLFFTISVFLHECGHGLANALAGIPCSTGFNRVGDIYKFPRDNDFRAFYSSTNPVLLDFGVPCTIALAIVGTVLFTKTKKEKLQYYGAALAIDNCLLRFIPCSLVLIMHLVTGKPHIEDEYETGQLLVQLAGNGMLLYVPALISWLIMVVCLVITARTARIRKVNHVFAFSAVSVLAIIIGFAIVFALDNFIRINWHPFV